MVQLVVHLASNTFVVVPDSNAVMPIALHILQLYSVRIGIMVSTHRSHLKGWRATALAIYDKGSKYLSQLNQTLTCVGIKHARVTLSMNYDLSTRLFGHVSPINSVF